MSELTYTVYYRHRTDPRMSEVQGSHVREMAIMNANLYNAIAGNPCEAIPMSVYFDVETQRYFYGTLDNVPSGK